MRKTLMALVLVGAAGVGVVRWQASAPATSVVEHDTKLLKDRVWVDHMPRSETDKMQLFIALTQRPRQPPIGLFEQVSMWEGHFEAFRYEAHGEEMRVVFPQNGDRETLTTKASRCNEGGMDYCLEVTGSSRGVKRYFSKKGWEIRSLDAVPSFTAKLLPQ